MQRIIPHLWFDGAAEEAAALYAGLIGGSRLGRVTRYTRAGFAQHGQPEGAVMTVEFELGGYRMVGLNGGPVFRFTPAVSYFVTLETEAEVDRLWEGLIAGGEALMPLDAYDWSPRYGWLNDRFGVSWQVALGMRSATGQTVTPALLFGGARSGRAEEAVEHYVSVFPGSRVEEVQRHDGSGPDPEGALRHARFRLGGETVLVTAGALADGFAFSEANSQLILCADQAEIDHYWSALSAEPAAEQCGWLRDRFGVSWQVVPERLMALLNGSDPERVRRVTEAFMGMRKLDLAALEAAAA